MIISEYICHGCSRVRTLSDECYIHESDTLTLKCDCGYDMNFHNLPSEGYGFKYVNGRMVVDRYLR